MKISITILKFLFIGALFLVSNYNLQLSIAEDRSDFYHLFYDWLGSLYNHSFELTGYVVNSEWLPEQNSTAIDDG